MRNKCHFFKITIKIQDEMEETLREIYKAVYSYMVESQLFVFNFLPLESEDKENLVCQMNVYENIEDSLFTTNIKHAIYKVCPKVDVICTPMDQNEGLGTMLGPALDKLIPVLEDMD